MDDHPLADKEEGTLLTPPPRVAMYLAKPIRGTWDGFFFGATWGVLLWGTVGAVGWAICGLRHQLPVGSMDEVTAEAPT